MGVTGGLPTRTLTDPSHTMAARQLASCADRAQQGPVLPCLPSPLPSDRHRPSPSANWRTGQPPPASPTLPPTLPQLPPPGRGQSPPGPGPGPRPVCQRVGFRARQSDESNEPWQTWTRLDSTRLELASTRARVTHYRRRPRSCLAQVRLLIDSPAPLGHESGPQRFPGPDSNPRGRPTSRLYHGHRTLPTGESRPQVQDAAPPPGGHARLPTGQLPWEGHRPSCPSL